MIYKENLINITKSLIEQVFRQQMEQENVNKYINAIQQESYKGSFEIITELDEEQMCYS